MQFGTVLTGAGVVGAALWIARWGVGETTGDPLLWAGAAMLTVLSVGVGSLMVKPVPLRAVVGPCLGMLCWSLGAVAGLDGDPLRAGIVGLVLLVVVPVTWERLRPLPEKTKKKARAQRAGSHAR